MKEQVNIVKIGGKVIDDPDALSEFLVGFSTLQGPKILVHGGGAIATKVAESLKIETQMLEGRRITDDAMIDVVVMTYGGLINKKIVSVLQQFGDDAIGLTGADANLILSEKRPVKDGVDFGWVGDPIDVNANYLNALLSDNKVPVIAPLTHDGKGNMLNTNADTIAAKLGVALARRFQTKVHFCFEHHGVLRNVSEPESLIKEIDLNEYDRLKSIGVISDGMIPKLDNAFEAINEGVGEVRIMNYQSILELQNEQYHEWTKLH